MDRGAAGSARISRCDLAFSAIVIGVEAGYAIYQGEWGAASAGEIVAALSEVETADHLRILALSYAIIVFTALPVHKWCWLLWLAFGARHFGHALRCTRFCIRRR